MSIRKHEARLGSYQLRLESPRKGYRWENDTVEMRWVGLPLHLCSVRLSVRTLPFHGRKEGFDSPTEYQLLVLLWKIPVITG